MSEVRTVPIPASKVVFVDFGKKGKVFAISDNNDEVVVFDSLNEMIEKLNPTTIVIDDLPSAHQKTAAEIAKTGIAILRIKDLKILAEERKKNGVRKTDENDVIILRKLYHEHPELFQPLCTDLNELKVRALTELWVFLTNQKRMSKYLRTITADDEDIATVHKTLVRLVDKVSKRIHEEALKLPLYRKAVEQLQLQGPALAYIVSHDMYLKTLSRDKLEVRYALYKRQWRRRPLRSQLLIGIAWATVKNGHPKYAKIYNEYRRRGKKHWQAILRVAKVILKDLARIAKSCDAA